jgi:hypothetical protein
MDVSSLQLFRRVYDVNMSNPIDVQLLRELRDVHTGLHWVQALARGNVRRNTGGSSEQAYVLAARIDSIEQQIKETYVSDKFFYRLPEGWWVWVPLLYYVGFWFAARRVFYEDRLMHWMWFLILLGGLALTFLVRKVAKESVLKRAKASLRPRLKGERAALMVQLMQTRDHVVENVPSM